MERSLTKAELEAFNALTADEALEEARKLKTVHVEWSNVGEIGGLEPFETAEVLYLQFNRIERIESLECLPRLQFLALQGNRISVLENLLCLTELELLDLSKNQIAKLDEQQLPKSVCILNLSENACTKVPDYGARVRTRLPDLLRLDGVDLAAEDDSASSPPTAAATGSGGSSSRPSTGGARPSSSGGGPGALASTLLDMRNASEEVLASTEKGLGAYWRKGEMQSKVETAMKDEIAAYSMEALADVEGFDRLLEDASSRSRARREVVSRQLPLGGALGMTLSRPGTGKRGDSSGADDAT